MAYLVRLGRTVLGVLVFFLRRAVLGVLHVLLGLPSLLGLEECRGAGDEEVDEEAEEEADGSAEDGVEDKGVPHLNRNHSTIKAIMPLPSSISKCRH